jgi:hypothetical protein
MSKKKYYQVDTKKIKGLDKIEAKSGWGIITPNLTKAGKSNIQAKALKQTNEECKSYYLLHPSHKWIDKFKEDDKKRRLK